MFVRQVKNRSGSVSVQVICKSRGRYKVVKTVGCATTQQEIELLESRAFEEIEKLTGAPKLFGFAIDQVVENSFSRLSNVSVRVIGPELVFGRIFDSIGFNRIKEDLFRHLVIARLSFPLSKLKTCEYLYRYRGIRLGSDTVYRFLDKLNSKLKPEVEQIAFAHTRKILNDNLSVVFYDMTTLYFEASDEDDLRKTGFSKDGKHQCPQIYIGLLVGLGGYAIGYDIFEGNIYEGDTLIPFLKNISGKFDIAQPIVIADAGLLSKYNIKALEKENYQYILGGKIKNESASLKAQILSDRYSDGTIKQFKVNESTRLIVSYSDKRAKKDAYNRKRGLERLEMNLKAGKLTKSSMNNRGYNKYLQMEGKVNITIDYRKYEQDSQWNGIKGVCDQYKTK